MPIYEYQCSKCNHQLEALQKIREAPITLCPSCGKNTLSKLVSASSFHLKGTGWYATDFKDKGSKPPKEDAAKKESSPTGENKKSEKKETKPKSTHDSD